MLEISEPILELINAQANVIEVVTYEWQRLYKSLEKVSETLKRQFLIFSPNNGMKIYGTNQSIEVLYGDVKFNNFLDVLTFFEDKLSNATLLIEDAEQYLDMKCFDIIRLIKEIAKDKSCNPHKGNKSIILQTSSRCLPLALTKEVSVLSLPYATRDEIKDIFDQVVVDIKHDHPKAKIFYEDCIGEALLGLSETEINRILRKVINTYGEITSKELAYFLKEKEASIENNSLLELIQTDKSLNDIGGLKSLKHWASHRKLAFSYSAKCYGLPMPKGVMLLGIPGCGKSMIAKAIAHDWHYPLLRLDFGRLYHRYVGDSESNLRHAIEIAEAMSPCVLWADEIEKGIAGAGRSDDNGIASRIFGTFLTWMQEKQKPVFIVATANHIKSIPAELFRKGRFDEIFFLDLPNFDERKSIITIHLNAKHNLGDDILIDELAKISEGFSGAEIECAINDALFEAFDSNEQNLTQPYLVKAFKETCPLSLSMAEDIKSIQTWGLRAIKPAR